MFFVAALSKYIFQTFCLLHLFIFSLHYLLFFTSTASSNLPYGVIYWDHGKFSYPSISTYLLQPVFSSPLHYHHLFIFLEVLHKKLLFVIEHGMVFIMFFIPNSDHLLQQEHVCPFHICIWVVGLVDGAGWLPVPGHPTTFAFSKVKACCACSRCGTGGLFFFIFFIYLPFLMSCLLGDS